MQKIPTESIYLRDGHGRTLQERLTTGLVRAILDGRWGEGARLPSTRHLAQSLGISRITVTLVYQEMVSQGYIKPLPRSGFVVAGSAPHRRVVTGSAHPAEAPRVNWSGWLRPPAEHLRIFRKPADWRDYRFPFIYGQADPALFDHSAWRDCARRALGARDFGYLAADQHGQDDPMLIDFICSNALPRRGISARPDEVLITLGTQNALYLLARLLTSPERLTVMEDPGYPDFAETLRSTGGQLGFVNVTDQGLDPDSLPPGTKVVFVTPSHNIPTGSTMPIARRQALLDRAAQEDFLIIEDDYEFEMSYLEPPTPALKSLDRAERVIYVGSFSKSLFPGLRIGYMVGAAPLIAEARRLRRMMMRHPPSHMQRITAYFLALGHYDTHIVGLRHALRERRQAIMEALAATNLRIAGTARQGGSSIWIEAAGIDSADLAARLTADSVLIEPGHVFFDTPPSPCGYFRLGYSSIQTDRIAAGIALIAKRIEDAIAA